ncbi:MAG: alanine--tRNA ligase, partial [Exiguobacterium sp.]|nr:alanine--tRNA ligase [Exiguobacterium sp.]
TGASAYEVMNQQIETLEATAKLLKTKPLEVPARVQALQAEIKEVERAAESLKAKLANIEASSLMDAIETIGGVQLIAKRVDGQDMDALRSMVDDLKGKLGSAVIILGSANGEKVNLVAGVTKDLNDRGFHAGKLIKEVATRCGGGGGGRPDMAQAGGRDATKLDEALKFASHYVESLA